MTTGKHYCVKGAGKNMSKAARTKGHNFEREIATAFRLAGWLGAKRHLEFQVQDCLGYDIEGVEPFRIQCKCYSDYAPISKIKEVKYQAGKVPMLVTRGDNLDTVCVLYFRDLIRILSQARARGLDLTSPTVADF